MSPQSGGSGRLGPGREFDRIRRILEGGPRGGAGIQVGPGDDAAVLAPPEAPRGLVLSTDLSIEGVHFHLEWITPEEAGYRAAAGGFSDLAAMGAEPLGILASVAAPGEGEGVEAVMSGVSRLAARFGAPLLGGDLTRSPGPLVVDVVSVGAVARPLLRSAVRPGDELWVTGTLGGAAAAVALWSRKRAVPPDLRASFAGPVPRIPEARWLADHGVRAGIDLSDGLGGDAGHLSAASGVGIVIEAAALPLHPGVREGELPEGLDPLELALHGGEDYELLVGAPAGVLGEVREAFAREFGVPLTRVGTVVEGDGVHLRGPESDRLHRLDRGGYDHFGASGTTGPGGGAS